MGARGAYNVVLTDLRMGQFDGIGVLRSVKESHADTEVIVMTAYGTIESAVEAMRLGAFDYIQKPFSEQELLVKVERANKNRRALQPGQLLANEFKEKYKFENIVGRSQAIREVLGRIVKRGPHGRDRPDHGRERHREGARCQGHPRQRRARDRPFVPVNCAAISETLLESELFGHARGSFTGAVSARKGLFEEADGGTFFFDEIAETPLTFQAKLLRAIQENEIRRVGENKPIQVDVRIIAATNQELLTSVQEKRFRQDLYYRLNVARFVLPPLRERREDIPVLATFFLEKFNRKMTFRSRDGAPSSKSEVALAPRARFAEGVLEAMSMLEFPGNIRELENMVEQAVALSGGGVITGDDIIPPTPPSRRFNGGRWLT